MTEIPAAIRDAARAAFAGRPADAEGQFALDSRRNPWTALDDALAAVVPDIEAGVRERVEADLLAVRTRMRADGASVAVRAAITAAANIARYPQDAPTAPEPPFRVPETLRARRAREAADRLLTLVDEVRDVMAYFDGQLTALATLHPTHADALRVTYRKLDALLAAPTAPAQPAGFWADLCEDLADPEFAAAYVAASEEIAARDAHENAQPATPATPDMETTGSAEGGTGDLSALHHRIADALTRWVLLVATGRPDAPKPHERALVENSLARAAVVMDVIRPELEHQRDLAEAALKGWKAEKERTEQAERTLAALRAANAEQAHRDRIADDIADQHAKAVDADLKALIKRAEQAEAVIERVRRLADGWMVFRDAGMNACATDLRAALDRTAPDDPGPARTHPDQTGPDRTPPDALCDEVARAIRTAVRVSPGPDVRKQLAANGNSTLVLSAGEADEAARVALDVIARHNAGPDRTEAGDPSALRDLVAGALTTACREHKHCTRQTTAVLDAILPHTKSLADLYRQAEGDVIALTKRAEQAERELATTAEAYEAACRISERAEREAREYRVANTTLQQLNVTRTERAQAAEASLARVRALHKLETHTTASGGQVLYCSHCCDGLIYEGPCETLTALAPEPEPTPLNPKNGGPS